MRQKAVVRLSRGLNSTTVAAIVKSEGFDVFALSFGYGQIHNIELSAAETVATALEFWNIGSAPARSIR